MGKRPHWLGPTRTNLANASVSALTDADLTGANLRNVTDLYEASRPPSSHLSRFITSGPCYRGIRPCHGWPNDGDFTHRGTSMPMTSSTRPMSMLANKIGGRQIRYVWLADAAFDLNDDSVVNTTTTESGSRTSSKPGLATPT